MAFEMLELTKNLLQINIIVVTPNRDETATTS